MRKKAKAEIEAEDLEAAIALCDKLVEDFEDAIPHPLYCHYMDLALERALQSAALFAFTFIFFEKSLDLGANTTPPLIHCGALVEP